MGIPRKRPKYRSGLEKKVSDILTKAKIEHQHEFRVFPYSQPLTWRKYLEDFYLYKHPDLICEAKGRFTSGDRKKMLLIKEQYPGCRILMIFGRADNTLSKTSKTTYGEWCTKNGISWVDIADFEKDPKSWINPIPAGILGTLTTKTKPKRRTLANSAA